MNTNFIVFDLYVLGFFQKHTLYPLAEKSVEVYNAFLTLRYFSKYARTLTI